MDRCLIFVHIPKTAGLTFKTILRLQYPKSRTLDFTTLDKPISEFASIPEEKRLEAKIVRGHVHYGIHRYIPKECTYATFLREPVSRVLSLYKYVRRTPQHPLHQRLTDMGLEDFIASGLDQAQTQNGQTRQICGQTDTDPDLATLQRAKQNLQSFAAVGLMEQFLESVVLFRRSLDWRIPPIYMTQNVAPSLDLDVSDQALALIRERNELDLELYEVARSLFIERVERNGGSFSKEVTLMKALNRIPNARLTQSLLNSPLRRKLQKGIARSGGER